MQKKKNIFLDPLGVLAVQLSPPTPPDASTTREKAGPQ